MCSIGQLFLAFLVLLPSCQCEILRCNTQEPQRLSVLANTTKTFHLRTDLTSINDSVLCDWRFSIKWWTGPVNFVLQPDPLSSEQRANASSDCSQNGMQYELAQPVCDGFKKTGRWCDQDSAPRVPIVLPVLKRHIPAEFRVRYQRRAQSTVRNLNLIVSIASYNYCGSGMLLFRDRCYFVTQRGLTLDDVETATRDYTSAASLATFDSVDTVHEFLHASKGHFSDYPNVRVGLYRCPGQQKLGYMALDQSGCPVPVLFAGLNASWGFNSGVLRKKFGCVSLNFSGSGLFGDSLAHRQLQPSDCAKRMPSLMVFDAKPDYRLSPACVSCGNVSEQRGSWTRIMNCSADPSNGPRPADSRRILPFVFVTIPICAFFVCLGLALLCRRMRLRRFLKSKNTTKRGNGEQLYHDPAESAPFGATNL